MTAVLARPGALFAGGALISLLAVGAALISQHVYDMQPCPWCVLQRLVFVLIALACLFGLAWRSSSGRIVSALLVLAFAAAGIAAALWQHFVAASSESCNLTLADHIMIATRLDGWLPDVFQARASCADAAIDLFGVPYEFWSLGFYVLLALVGVRLMQVRD
jgi:disulfide bond formation protein DsbB